MYDANKCTLTPNNKKQAMDFLQSRKEDVQEMFFFACVFAAVRLAFSVTVAMHMKTRVSYLVVVTWSLINLMHWAIYVIGKRFSKSFMYMAVVLFVVINLLSVLALDIALRFDQDKTDSFTEFRRDVVIYSCTSLLLLSPSIEYVIFCYVPVTLITSSYCVIRHNMDKTTIPYFVLTQIFLPSFWYIF